MAYTQKVQTADTRGGQFLVNDKRDDKEIYREIYCDKGEKNDKKSTAAQNDLKQILSKKLFLPLIGRDLVSGGPCFLRD